MVKDGAIVIDLLAIRVIVCGIGFAIDPWLGSTVSVHATLAWLSRGPDRHFSDATAGATHNRG
jgi:hypothetical protein